MNFSRSFTGFALLILAFGFMLGLVNCAQPLPPVGGARDSLPPVLVKALPQDSIVHFQGNKITLEFNEYIQLDNNLQDKLVFSPVPKIQPQLEARLKVLTVKIKDTLEPNTTYAIDFGDAIKDINENNPLKNFRYIFTTGAALDDNGINGRVLLAETGKPDSTLIVILHRDKTDSAVAKVKPRYYTRLNGRGEFSFKNIAAGTYNIFALKDAGALRYDSKSQLIAFLDSPVVVQGQRGPIALYASAQSPEPPRPATGTTSVAPLKNQTKAVSEKEKDKRIKFTTSLENGHQDILSPFVLTFENKVKTIDSTKFRFTDTTFQPVSPFHLVPDTSNTKLVLNFPWTESTIYKLILEKDALADSIGNTIVRADTITIRTKRESDYGSLRIRFTNFTEEKHALLLFMLGNTIAKTVPATASEVNYKLFKPGEYELRIVYDRNQNGQWDTGDYWTKLQPERTVALPKKMNIRSNWDNEMTVEL
jgi:hypothetical protein